MVNYQVGDLVLVAEASNQKYRPDLVVVEILSIRKTTHQTVYTLSDGSSIKNERKMRLLGS